MQCPYCNGEMKKGYIDQTDFRFPLKWSPADQERGVFMIKNREIKLTSSLKCGYVIAYRCEQCRKMIIDEETIEV